MLIPRAELNQKGNDMKIKDIIEQNDITLSFEVFPPKSDDGIGKVENAARQIASLGPQFMSVTYGADGGSFEYTTSIASDIQNRMGTTVMAHMTCVSSDRDQIDDMLAKYKERGVENIMALRGDIPEGGRTCFDFEHASDLVRAIKEEGYDFCIGGACYPEGHVESDSPSEDIKHLKTKVDAGCDFLVTQMFFDNDTMYNFMYRLREAGINVPVLAGIMPITNAKQVARSVKLSGATIPQRFRMIVDRFGNDPAKMKQAGVIYATEQIIDLISNGITNIHVYSMNKPDIVKGIMDSMSEILR